MHVKGFSSGFEEGSSKEQKSPEDQESKVMFCRSVAETRAHILTPAL